MTLRRQPYVLHACRRTLLVAALTIQSVRHLRPAFWLMTRSRSSLVGRFLTSRPELRWITLTPMVSARWSAARRFAALKTHFEIAASIGGPLAVGPFDFVELLNLEGIRPGLHVTLDAPRWLLREGLLSLSLWIGDRRVYMLSFCLGKLEGQLVAYVGGLQGVKLEDGGQLFRDLTKQSHGQRPRDLVFELFKSLCRSIGVPTIYAICDEERHHNSQYNQLWVGEDPVKGAYNEIWCDRGGVLGSDGFFVIPAKISRRSKSEIPVRKKATYGRRYRMIDQIDSAMCASVAAVPMVSAHPNLGVLRTKNVVCAI